MGKQKGNPVLGKFIPAHTAVQVFENLHNGHSLSEGAAEGIVNAHTDFTAALILQFLRGKACKVTGAGKTTGEHNCYNAVVTIVQNLFQGLFHILR